MADAKQGKTADECYNGPSQSRIILAKPRLGGFGSSGFASTSGKSANPFGSVLRPPQLKPGANPFLKVDTEETNIEEDKEKAPEGNDRLKETKDEGPIPKFVPLRSTNSTPRSTTVQPTTSAIQAPGFVFGQNLSERVVIQENIKNGEASAEHSSSNGTSELLFTSAAASVKENNQDEAGPSEPNSNTNDGLAANAAEYERSHARPPPPTTNITVTGEEDETNVLQISCRLFAWEAGSWRERGRGVLRLNDAAGGARLVARTAGSLRVVLNTKLWPDMVAERAGTKSLRITAAIAHDHVKLFLIMGAPSDIAQLHRALKARIAVSKRSTTVVIDQETKSQQSAERLDAAADDDFNQQDGDVDFDEKSNGENIQDDENSSKEERLENSTDKTDGVDDETKASKRKEPMEDEVVAKRPCPDQESADAC
ncbi:ran-binding protein 3 [Aricia agestis]|uniref:ran-binding protein 3 n=1 Tax=Aricia agestis TaxID=91739 RepID=UPI001C20BA09|nr:ran-binding protein 3 [Aricia agestis]